MFDLFRSLDFLLYSLLVFGISLIGLLGCEEGSPPNPTGLNGIDTPMAGDPAAPSPAGQAGAALYAQRCAACHGAQGEGAAPYPGSIQGASPINDVVVNGRGTMPAMPDLTPTNVADIERYLASFVALDRPLTVAETYARDCAACHGATGDGAARGPQILEPVRDYAKWVVRSGRSGAGYNDPMPGYSTSVLTEETLDGMIDWLQAAPRPTDGAGLYRRFCGNCHGPDGRGGPTGEGIRGDDLDEYIEVIRDGEGGRNYGRRGSYMPSWSRAELSDAEIRKLWEYIN